MGCPDRKDTEFSDLSRSGGSLFASASGVRSGGVPAVLGGKYPAAVFAGGVVLFSNAWCRRHQAVLCHRRADGGKIPDPLYGSIISFGSISFSRITNQAAESEKTPSIFHCLHRQILPDKTMGSLQGQKGQKRGILFYCSDISQCIALHGRSVLKIEKGDICSM